MIRAGLRRDIGAGEARLYGLDFPELDIAPLSGMIEGAFSFLRIGPARGLALVGRLVRGGKSEGWLWPTKNT